MNVDFFDLVKSVLTEHNRIRQDLVSYIPILQEHLKYFKGDILHRPKEIPTQTYEGPQAVEEAIQFLKKQKPLDALTFDERLGKACEDHVRDMGQKGLLSHDSSDGKSMSDRVELYCEWDNSCGENIDVGSKTGQDVIVNLIIDDGIENRGHRINIFKPDYKYMGIASGTHREFDTITVLDYVGGVREKGKPFYDYKNFKYEYPKDVNSGFKKLEKATVQKKEAKPKTSYQLNDDDAPEETVSVRINKKTKIYQGKKITVTKKCYTLEDGTQHIVELEEF